MEKLKTYLKNEIIFDYHDDENGENFNSVLFDELERLTIYTANVKNALAIDPEKIIFLATQRGAIERGAKLEDIVYNAFSVLAFDYMYSELKAEYMSFYEGEDGKQRH